MNEEQQSSDAESERVQKYWQDNKDKEQNQCEINLAKEYCNNKHWVNGEESNRQYNNKVAVNNPSPEKISKTNIKNKSSTMTFTQKGGYSETIFACSASIFIIVKLITIIGACLGLAVTKAVTLGIVFASLAGAFNALLVVVVTTSFALLVVAVTKAFVLAAFASAFTAFLILVKAVLSGSNNII